MEHIATSLWLYLAILGGWYILSNTAISSTVIVIAMLEHRYYMKYGLCWKQVPYMEEKGLHFFFINIILLEIR